MREMAFERSPGGGGIFAKLVNLAVFAAEMGRREFACLQTIMAVKYEQKAPPQHVHSVMQFPVREGGESRPLKSTRHIPVYYTLLLLKTRKAECKLAKN